MSRALERAYSAIREMILTGKLEAGEQLREEGLAEMVGVSRTPIRDALRRLEAELFIVRSDTREDVDEMFTLRGMLEAHAAERAATRFTPETLAELRHSNEAIERSVQAAKPDPAAFLDGNREFHQIIMTVAQSPRLASTLATLVEQPVVRRTAALYNREQLAQSATEHRELIRAFHTLSGLVVADVP
jgi:DNA-binding GntR family transcriptional regulator